ncbi:MAG: DUF1330 domain-containing protein [Gammaproteobacteria bacterium]|nr:DUF1330 domain-containing protein [Gammaproteobacteria bacterium]
MSTADKPVYLVVAMNVDDLDDFIQRYAIDVVGQLHRLGAELLAAGTPDALEGNPGWNRAVVIRFPSRQVADDWYRSAEYAPFKRLRLETLATDGMAMFIETFDPGALGQPAG